MSPQLCGHNVYTTRIRQTKTSFLTFITPRFSFSGRWTPRHDAEHTRGPGANKQAVVEMLPYVVVVVVVVTFVYSSRSSGHVAAGADEFFPDTLLFEGLGLADVMNGSGVTGSDAAVAMLPAGDLNDALNTMNFHRYHLRFGLRFIFKKPE